jgi:RNA polymerase sigma-70 factor (ECF subfamily)
MQMRVRSCAQEGPVTDDVVLERAAAGDRDAFATLAAPRLGRMFATALLILRDRGHAEDAVQEALVRAWRDLRSLRDPRRFDPWLRRLLVNACRDESRRGRRHELNVRLLPDHDRPTEDSSRELEDRDMIGRALRRLSTEHRAVLVHQYYLDLAIAEVADALDIPVGTAKSRLHHARNALREAVELDTNRSEGHIA